MAVIYNLPILCKEWIDHVWQNRREINFNPNDENILAKYRLKPFTDLRIALYNFRPKELAEKTKLIIDFFSISVLFILFDDSFITPLYYESFIILIIFSFSFYLTIIGYPLFKRNILNDNTAIDGNKIIKEKSDKNNFKCISPCDSKLVRRYYYR